MGCDIHGDVEIKVRGKWLHYSRLDSIDRNYNLFTLIAGVRKYDDSIEPIDKPRGYPVDVTEMTALNIEVWGSDGHSHTWLNADEIKIISEFIEKQNGDDYSAYKQIGWLFNNSFSGFVKYPEDRPEILEDVRMILWFDN